MANERVGVDLEVNAAPVQNIRTAIREANAELIRAQELFGDYSAEALAAARNVAELRDRVQEANETAQLFDPGRTFQAIVGVGQAIAGGFAAAQGAMALFGVESKEVEQALLKVQAAMALATGLSAVKDSIKDFQRLGAMLMQISIVQKANAAANTAAAATMRAFGVATTQTGVAFNVLKGAIVATGIGALIVVVTALISKISEWSSAADEAAAAQKRLQQAAIDSEKEWTQKLLEGNRSAEALAVARAKAEGKSADEILQIQRRAAADRIQILTDARAQVASDDKAYDEANKAVLKEREGEQIKEYERQAAALDASEKKKKELRDKAEAARKAAEDKAKAERKAALDAALAAEQQTADEIFALRHTTEENELYQLAQKMEKRLAIERKAGRDTADVIALWALERNAIEKKHADERVKLAQEEAAKKDEIRKKDLEALLAAQDEQTTREKEYADKRKQYTEAELNHKRGITLAAAQLAEVGAGIAGEQTAAGKALAIVAATISMYSAAQQAYLSAFLPVPTIASPALGVLSAAAAVAVGLNNIRKIAGIQVPGKGGGSAVPAISTASPITPQGSTSQPVQIDQNQVNQMGNALNQRVYVLESDITSTQDRVARTQQAATFK